MAFATYEPDPPTQKDELGDYIYNELQRIADVLNENFNDIEKRLIILETP